jgi:hypothetical protein
MQTVGSDDHPQQIAQPTQSVTTATSAAAAANATALQQQQAQLAIDVATQQSQQQPIHFDQALGYLNKIKAINCIQGILSKHVILGTFFEQTRNL